MHTLIGQYWWIVLALMVIVMITFILVTGRSAGGGL